MTTPAILRRRPDPTGDRLATAIFVVALIHGLGLKALAEGVDDPVDLAALWSLGFDGATGPAVMPPEPDPD